LDSHFSCHSDVEASKFSSSKLELTSSLEHESLDGGRCDSALDSSPIATPKLVASSGVAQGDSNGKGASHFFGIHTPKPKFHCTFCKKDGHTVEFCFRHVKHERCVILIWAPSQVLGLMLIALSPKGLLTYMRMVIRPLGPCFSIGLCTIALFVARMGIKRTFATAVQGKCGDLVILGLWLFTALFMA
jgi:hypothetical protein